MSNFIVGLTGGIGSGKSAATDVFARQGVVIVDADAIARTVVEPGSPALAQIAEHFGPGILHPDQSLDREQLRQIVFTHPDEKIWLEKLTHPLIRQDIQRQLADAQSPYVILSAPLLLDTDLHTITHRILVIDCDEAIQIERASRRDNNDPDMIKSIIAQQMPRAMRLSKADDVIENNGSLEDLQQAVTHYHQNLLDSLANQS